MKKIIYSTFVLGSIVLGSCSKDFTENDLNSNFSDNQMAALAKFPESAMVLNNGLESGGLNLMFKSGVAEVGSHEDFGQKAVDIIVDAMSNDVAYANINWFSYHYTYQDRLESYNTATVYNYYNKLAHSANQVIQSVLRTDSKYESNAIYGRALALRAFANLNLIRLYEYNGDGISIESIDEKGEQGPKGEFIYKLNRVPASEVKKFIENDLVRAYTILEGYSRPNANYINQSVVAGILSRYYLYTEEFAKAKDYAKLALGGNIGAASFDVVNSGNFSSIANADWMWGTAIDGSSTTFYASYFSHMDSFNVGYGRVGNTTKSIDKRLYDEMNGTDKRKTEWFADGKRIYSSPNWKEDAALPLYVNTKFIDKTKFLGDYCYMRKTEILFNYMEAAIKLGEEGEAKKVLVDYMSTRDKGYDINKRLASKSLFEEFKIQKRIELWGEGFGLIDMKRWGTSLVRIYEGTNHIAKGQLKDIIAPSAKFTLQLPKAERDANPLLSPQNPIE
ncbi:SusD family protein [Myroides marinus]|uniref:SusD family protein n=1 Tax=Myroides marinus TaxID=703342 RepID=A0A1H6R096_9FLAO|nr:RagB/SusD family nutrient uptake outer membrane protein [Myroides marinus]SEI49309.1 SusD family protein [Myroides marinus]